MLMFSSEGYKDTAINAVDSGEFVHNYASRHLADEMNVAKAYASLECKVTDVIEIKNIQGDKTGAVTIIGQVVGVHLDDAVIRNGRFDVELTEPITRLGYLDFGYSTEFHEMIRPKWD